MTDADLDEMIVIGGDELILDGDAVYKLGMALDAWALLARGRKGHHDEIKCLPDRRLSHDLKCASLLIHRLLPSLKGTTFDLRYRTHRDIDDERDSEIAGRIVKRLLGDAVFEHWSYKILPRSESGCDEDLIARAARSGDLEARLMLRRGCEVEAWIFKRHGFLIKDDHCLPEPAEATAAADEALRQALGPDAHRYVTDIDI